ncbi:MAG TPA: hypothetical protein VD838_19450, partial [Anaeromyxobacteraceae bacterium]|nr:hypothetical protein [Anaeromyxobacteraceae bacterium]
MSTAVEELSTSDARARVRRHLETERRAEITGIAGGARGHLARELLSPGPARARAILAVAPDEHEADVLAK